MDLLQPGCPISLATGVCSGRGFNHLWATPYNSFSWSQTLTHGHSDTWPKTVQSLWALVFCVCVCEGWNTHSLYVPILDCMVWNKLWREKLDMAGGAGITFWQYHFCLRWNCTWCDTNFWIFLTGVNGFSFEKIQFEFGFLFAGNQNFHKGNTWCLIWAWKA